MPNAPEPFKQPSTKPSPEAQRKAEEHGRQMRERANAKIREAAKLGVPVHYLIPVH